MQPFKFLSHPADIKLKVYGNDLVELFSNAAKGMMSFIYGPEAQCSSFSDYKKIDLKADNSISLLHDWLAELLYLSNTNYRLYADYKISKCDETNIIAEVGSCAAQAEDDIKAVTYSEISIKRIKNKWEAIIVFDI